MIVRALVLAVLVGALAGCGADERPTAGTAGGTAAVPARGADRSPAATAGGACALLDFYAVEQLVGVLFDVAAAGQQGTTATCVLQRSAADYPDLTLAVSPTAVAAAGFKAAVAPRGAADLRDVGQAAYQFVRPAPGTDPAGPGPGVEVGFLSRANKLIVLRFRLAADKPPADAEAMAPKMAELARFVDSN